MREFENVAELADCVGEEIGVSDWFSIDQEMINAACILYDMDPIIKDIMRHFRSPKAKAWIEAQRVDRRKKRKRGFQLSQTSNDLSASMAVDEDKSKELIEEEEKVQNAKDDDNNDDE